MTAPNRPTVTEEIQRYQPVLDPSLRDNGAYVLYADHVAALASQSKRVAVEAKIEVLEEMRVLSEKNWFCAVKNTEIVDEIARLRKEIE